MADAERPNVFSDDFDLDVESHGFVQRRVRVGQRAGSERLGASVYELPPGGTPFPYHVHYANEELLVVLSGTPSVRLPDGWHELAVGDVLAFRVGEEGAHQVSNRSSEPARVLIVSTMVGPEVVRQPDSQKVLSRAGAPGTEGDFRAVFRAEDEADYW